MNRFVSLWAIMEAHFKPYAGMIAQELLILQRTEQGLKKAAQTRGLPEPEREKLKPAVNALLDFATFLKCNISKGRFGVLYVFVINDTAVSEIRGRIRDSIETFTQELHEISFLAATDDMKDFLNKPIPYGDAVAQAFPNSIDDISEAHQCFALGRYTASMFHIGRVMEDATKRFGKRIKAKTPDRDEWQRWLKAINDVINKMPFASPKQRKKREPLAEAAAYFLHFKEAWRNKTMHPGMCYTREQALEILKGAHFFLDSVSRRIFKAKPI